MQGQGSTPFHLLQLTGIPPLVPIATDRAIPFIPIPIYFIHSLAQPRNRFAKMTGVNVNGSSSKYEDF